MPPKNDPTANFADAFLANLPWLVEISGSPLLWIVEPRPGVVDGFWRARVLVNPMPHDRVRVFVQWMGPRRIGWPTQSTHEGKARQVARALADVIGERLRDQLKTQEEK